MGACEDRVWTTHAEHMQTSTFRRVFKAFHYRDFRLMWFGACTSSIGTWMQIVAQGWLIYRLSHSAFLLALDQFLGGIPIFLFSLIGGVVADRVERRKVLLVSQYMQMAKRNDAHDSGGQRIDPRLAHPLSLVRLRLRAGLWRAGLLGADSYAGRSRGHAQRHRAELDPVQPGGNDWPGARRA